MLREIYFKRTKPARGLKATGKFGPLTSDSALVSVFAAATTAILVVMMMVVMPVIVGMIMVVVTAFRMVMTAAQFLFVTAPLPAGEQHEEKSGGEHENENDERVHSVA